MDGIRKILLRFSSFDKRVKMYRKMGIKIGSNCQIYPNVNFGSEPYLVSLGDNVRITSGCKFITHDGGIWVLRNMKLIENGDIFGKIEIGNNVHIGINTIIMPNVKIGNNCIIGCGAIVTKDIPDNSIAVGVPARVIESIEDYYNKHKDDCHYTKNMDSKQKKEYILEHIK